MTARLICCIALGILCGCKSAAPRQVTVDLMDERPVLISKDGYMSFDGAPLSTEALVQMVEERVEQDQRSNVPSGYSTIFLKADPETPVGKVEAIHDLIQQHGGTPARRIGTGDAQPATAPYSEPAARSPQG